VHSSLVCFSGAVFLNPLQYRRNMQLVKDIIIHDIGLIIKDVLVLSDIHLGFEEAQNRLGVFLPRVSFKALLDRLQKMLDGRHFAAIILNGDIKHEFGLISSSEWRTILQFIDFLKQYTNHIIMIEGNHDPLLKYIAKKRAISLVDYVFVHGVYVTHGDVIPNNADFTQASIVVMGHDHPAIGLRQGARKEVYKCFLVGKWKRKQLIVMPSCTLLSEGSDILAHNFLSPFLQQDIHAFEVYVVADTVYFFGKAKDIASQ